jgi:hypothetical protein
MSWAGAGPYVASGVALLIGVFGPYIAARTTRATFEHQRLLAREERFWHRRADVYVDLLKWAAEARAYDRAGLHNPTQMRANAEAFAMPMDLDARLTAYASFAVYAAAHAFTRGIAGSDVAAADLLIAAAAKASPADIGRLQGMAAAAAADSDRLADDMARIVSGDLHGVVPWDAGRPPSHSRW